DDSGKPVLTEEEERRAKMYAAILAGRLTVEQQERTNLVNISVQSTNPKVSAAVADKVALVFQEQDADREMAGARQAAEDLRKSIEDLQITIRDQEAQLIADMSSSGLPLQEKGQDLAASRLQSMSQAWLNASENR